MSELIDLAVASWRLEKWLENTNVERKMAARSSLRSIKKYLDENGIETKDITGTKFDIGLAIIVVNNESENTNEDELIISEMVKPIVLQDGAVIQPGQVILGDTIKEQKVNNEVKAEAEPQPDLIAEIQKLNDQIKQLEEDKSIADSKIESMVPKKKYRLAYFGMAIAVLLLICVLGVCLKNMVSKPGESANTTDDSNSTNNIENAIEPYDNSSELQEIENLKGQVADLQAQVEDRDQQLSSREDPGTESESESIDSEGSEPDEGQDEHTTISIIVYYVKKGDSLTSICDDLGYSYEDAMQEVLDLNKLDNPNLIYVGQKLYFPDKK